MKLSNYRKSQEAGSGSGISVSSAPISPPVDINEPLSSGTKNQIPKKKKKRKSILSYKKDIYDINKDLIKLGIKEISLDLSNIVESNDKSIINKFVLAQYNTEIVKNCTDKMSEAKEILRDFESSVTDDIGRSVAQDLMRKIDNFISNVKYLSNYIDGAE